MGRGKHRGYSGESIAKKMRTAKKRERQLRKLTRQGRLSGENKKALENRIPALHMVVELRTIGSGWFPKITQAVWAKLQMHESTSVGQYTYIVDRVSSNERYVYFKVCTGEDLTSKERRDLGTFLIDTEEKTIRNAEKRII